MGSGFNAGGGGVGMSESATFLCLWDEYRLVGFTSALAGCVGAARNKIECYRHQLDLFNYLKEKF